MTIVRRWGLAWSVVATMVLVGGPLLLHPVLRTDIFGGAAVLLLVSWVPMLIGGLITWGLVKALGRRDELDRRVRSALEGHSLNRELAWQIVLICCFVLSMLLLSYVFHIYGEETGTTPDLAMAVALVPRLLFFFGLPLVLMDRSGLVLDGKGTAMPAIALKVSDPWRWLGLIPAAVSVGMIGYLVTPHIGIPAPSLLLYAMLLAFGVIVVCEEIFFRAIMQSRLEILLGRWGGIWVASVIFAMTYAFIQPYDAVSQLPGGSLVYNTGLSLLTYAAAGLFYGYLWACFRNTWINVLMRMAMFVVILPPDLRAGI